MIITKTPFRISFVGGGSDLEDFYSRSDGAVLSTSIDKYMYISSHNFFDEDKFRIKYSRTETVNNLEEIRHPIVREVLKKFNINGALEISSNADVPAGTGLGSSSAFTVGMLQNMYTIQGYFANKSRLAMEACEIEIEKLKEPIGKQDQYAAAYGGLNIITFKKSGSVNVEPVHVKRDILKKFQENLIMFYLGKRRRASDILQEQKQNMISDDKFHILKDMVALVPEMRNSLHSENLKNIGRLLHENWLLKQKLASKISNDEINLIYEHARKNGALGGKLLGAGGSGFLLLYCEKEEQQALKQAMNKLREMPFQFENQGSRVIYAGEE